jgi:hypothetical protein
MRFDAMSDPIDRLKARWVADGLTLRPGASSEALDAFEATYGVSLPSLLRDYFASVDGTGDDSDGVFMRFWTLAEFMPIEEYHSCGPGEAVGFENWFYFADFMISSHNFAVRLTSDPTDGGPVMFADGGLYPLAPSFSAFLERYLTDRESLRYYLPPAEA